MDLMLKPTAKLNPREIESKINISSRENTDKTSKAGDIFNQMLEFIAAGSS